MILPGAFHCFDAYGQNNSCWTRQFIRKTQIRLQNSVIKKFPSLTSQKWQNFRAARGILDETMKITHLQRKAFNFITLDNEETKLARLARYYKDQIRVAPKNYKILVVSVFISSGRTIWSSVWRKSSAPMFHHTPTKSMSMMIKRCHQDDETFILLHTLG